jgi:FlaA1/EpsC-like NDP-sugar epimerase
MPGKSLHLDPNSVVKEGATLFLLTSRDQERIGNRSVSIDRCLGVHNPTGRHPNMFSGHVLKGKKILITGGGTGIGKSLGTRFLHLGAEIVICGRRE